MLKKSIYHSPYWWRLSNESPMTGILLPLMVGILLGESDITPHSFAAWLLGIGAVLLTAAAAAGLARRKARNKWHDRLFATLTCIALIALGLASDHIERDRTTHQWPEGEKFWTGVVAEAPHFSEKACQLTVRLVPDGQKIRLSILKSSLDSVPQIGDALQFYAEIKQPYNFAPRDSSTTTNTFDYARWLQRQGFSGQAFTPTQPDILPQSDAEAIMADLGPIDRLSICALQLRSAMLQNYSRINLDTDEAGVIAALTLGDKSALSKDVRHTFSQTGASHVLALSGLHLGILILFVMMLLRPLRRWRWAQWATVVVCIIIAGGFALLTGCSVSVMRATLMLTIALLLSMRGEGLSSLNNVVLAAFVMLIISPQSLMDTGFQLSFAAVGGLLLLMPYYQDWKTKYRKRKVRHVIDFLYVTLVAQLFTAPIVACVFGQVPTLFIITNLLVIPCTYILLIGGLLYIALSWWTVIATPIGWALAFTLKAMLGGLQWISQLPFSSIEVNIVPATCWCIYALLLSLIGLAVSRRKKYLWLSILSAGLIATFQFWLT